MTNSEITADEQARMVGRLQQALAAAHGRPVERIETHISWVLIAGGDVFKFKKALQTDFLDYATLARRRHCCTEELRLNRRLAPTLYVAVVDITGTADAPRLGGAGPTIDHAVQMRAFDPRQLWQRLALRGELVPAQIDEAVRLLQHFHAGVAVAAPGDPYGHAAQARGPLREMLQALAPRLAAPADRAAREALAALQRWEAHTGDALAPLFEARQAAGRVRECHGDLHLGNIAQHAGRVTVFDGIEFSATLRWIDIASEYAFLAMDLHAHRLPALAHRLVDGLLQAADDVAGAPVLRYHLVHRAVVRAWVGVLREAQAAPAPDPGPPQAAAGPTARDYLQLALRLSAPPRPALLITHGCSGSGKTTLTQGLLEAIGAIRLRADVERKRLAGLAPTDRGGTDPAHGLYREEMTRATHARLRDLARPALQAGFPVILDATFLRRSQRDAARALAASLGLPFAIVDFPVPLATLQARVRARQAQGDDASDAGLAVLAAQWREAEPLAADERAAVFSCAAAAAGGAGDAAPPAVDWRPLQALLAAAVPPACTG